MRKMLSFLAVAVCAAIGCAQEKRIAESELYHIQLDKLQIPRGIIKELSEQKHVWGSLADSRIYIEVFRNGNLAWRSPVKEVGDGTQELFIYDKSLAETSFAMFWKPQDEVAIKVFMAEEKAVVKATVAGGGALAGAGAGAVAGGIGASAFTGGLGAPAGALIGAGIGFIVGGGASAALLPVAGAREITTFVYPKSDEFNLFTAQKEIEPTSRAILQKGNACITLSGEKITARLKHGELELQKKYLVRVRSIFLSPVNRMPPSARFTTPGSGPKCWSRDRRPT